MKCLIIFVLMKFQGRKIYVKIIAIITLAVFSLAVTPWSIFHHHEAPVPTEKNCNHSVHVKLSTSDCLVCHVHFEKNFIGNLYDYIVHLKVELIKYIFPIFDSFFSEPVGTSLRAPPMIVLH